MANHQRLRGMLLVALAAASWGTIGAAVALLNRITTADAFSTGFWRMAISAPALLLLSRWLTGANFWRVQARDRLHIGSIAAAFAAYQVCYFAAIERIGLSSAVMLNICSAPVFVALLAALLLHERPGWAVAALLLPALCGVWLLVRASPAAGPPTARIAGALLALSAGLCYSVVAVSARALAPRYHPLQPVALAFPLGALLLLPFALQHGLQFAYPANGWLLLLYIGLVPTVGGYGLYLWGLQTTPAPVAAIIALIEPLLGAGLALSLLGETLAPAAAAGAALLLASICALLLLHARESTRAPLP